MLKADLHIHTREDIHDGKHIDYTAKDIISLAARKGYEVLSITNHETVFYDEELRRFAAEKGILLIPGIEKSIKGKHVLIYNITQDEAEKIKTLEDLEDARRKDTLIVAAHPYFPFIGLKHQLEKSIRLFDGIEYSSFCHKMINFNKKAVKAAKNYKKPVIGNSDLHGIYTFDQTYSFIDSKKETNSIISAIKNNDVQYISKPLSYASFLRRGFAVGLRAATMRLKSLFWINSKGL